jgi:hypothetical protein
MNENVWIERMCGCYNSWLDEISEYVHESGMKLSTL